MHYSAYYMHYSAHIVCIEAGFEPVMASPSDFMHTAVALCIS